jgi:pimeloyl-ACP methyl ester carboxylesterase
MRPLRWLAALLLSSAAAVSAQVSEQVVDLPTRPGVTQRLLVLAPPQPRAAVVLFAGGHGGLQIQADGTLRWGAGNFLVRARQRFAAQGLLVAVIDAPSDRQAPPFLGGFRQRPEHAADAQAVIAWLRSRARKPVWLVGTSRGTQSAGWLATELNGADGPDGIVLTATILSDDRGRPVPAMPLERIRVPVLVVHHEQDGCRHCAYADLPPLMERLAHVPKRELIAFRGGENIGDPCEARAYHGFNGIEDEVVARIAAWMLAAK